MKRRCITQAVWIKTACFVGKMFVVLRLKYFLKSIILVYRILLMIPTLLWIYLWCIESCFCSLYSLAGITCDSSLSWDQYSCQWQTAQLARIFCIIFSPSQSKDFMNFPATWRLVWLSLFAPSHRLCVTMAITQSWLIANAGVVEDFLGNCGWNFNEGKLGRLFCRPNVWSPQAHKSM